MKIKLSRDISERRISTDKGAEIRLILCLLLILSTSLLSLGFPHVLAQKNAVHVDWEFYYPKTIGLNEKAFFEIRVFLYPENLSLIEGYEKMFADYTLVASIQLENFNIIYDSYSFPATHENTRIEAPEAIDSELSCDWTLISPEKSGNYSGELIFKVKNRANHEIFSKTIDFNIKVSGTFKKAGNLSGNKFEVIVDYFFERERENAVFSIPLPIDRPYFRVLDEKIGFSPRISLSMEHASSISGVHREMSVWLPENTSGHVVIKRLIEWSLPEIKPKNVGNKFPKDVLNWTKPSICIESNNPEIIEKAREIVGNETNVYKKVEDVLSFVYSYIEYNESVPENCGALWTLRNKRGDCTQMSYLSSALLRALGIPARIVNGMWGGFLHAWNEVYLPNYGWVPADAVALGIGRDLIDHVPFHVDVPHYLLLPLFYGNGTISCSVHPIITIGKNTIFARPLVSVLPSSEVVHSEEEFNATVYVNPGGRGISSGEVDLAFDPNVLEVIKVYPGNLLGENPIQGMKEINNTAGTLGYALARVGETVPPTPAGSFAIVEFKVKGNVSNGNHSITVSRVGLADENLSRIENIETKNAVIKIITLRGDINGDGVVDYIDLAILGSSYGKHRGERGFNRLADLNGDNVVDYLDLAILGSNYGRKG